MRADGKVIEAQTPLGFFCLPVADLLSLTRSTRDYDLNLYGASSAQFAPAIPFSIVAQALAPSLKIALNKGAKRVIATEIAPDILPCLRRTFTTEIRDRRVVVFPKGGGTRMPNSRFVFRISSSSLAGSVVFQHESAGAKVLLTTIDKITAELQLDKVDFIKMDI